MSDALPNFNLPKDAFAAIGEVMVLWSWMQGMMDVAIYSMLQTKPSKGAWITAPLRYNARMDILKSIGFNYFSDNPDAHDEFKKHIKEIGACYTERNRIDHAL